MSTNLEVTPPAPPGARAEDDVAAHAGGPGPWSRHWVRVTAMVVGLAVAMLAVNSVASSLSGPITALLVGPLLAVAMLGLYRSAVRRLERRPAVELAPRRATRRVLAGTAGGLLLATVTIGTLALLGGYRVTGWGSVTGALTVLGIMCAVAVAEEVFFRGVVFRLVEQRWGTWLALGVSAPLFGLVHLVNPSATPWGAVAIAIEAGLMLGAAYVATRSLWLPIGLHLGWNVTITAIFGTVTSGSEAQDALVTATTPGPLWLTGGAFGPEASVVAVVVCSVATALLLVTAHRRGHLQRGRRRPARV